MKMKRSFVSLIGADPDLDDSHSFETSWLLPPTALAILRGTISLYIFVTIFVIWGWYGTHKDVAEIEQSFSYFTWLTYWGLGFYFLVSCVHTSLYAATGRSVLFDKLPRVLRGLHSIYYTTVTTYPFLVTIVFWSILFSGTWFTKVFDAWQNISQHGLNSLYALLEILLTTTRPHPLLNLAFVLLFLALYVGVAYLTHYTEGWYTYSFLDPSTRGSSWVAIYCFGILAAILLIFAISALLIWVRRKLTRGKVKRSFWDLPGAKVHVEPNSGLEYGIVSAKY